MRPTLIATLVLFAAACGTSPSSNPVSADAVGTRTPAPPDSPLANVSGTWTGQISYDYGDDWCACCTPTAFQASATFTQDGSQVRGQIHSACFDEEFTGALQDGQLRGTAKVNAGTVTYDGQVAGPATTDRFYLTTEHLQQDGGQQVSGYSIRFSR